MKCEKQLDRQETVEDWMPLLHLAVTEVFDIMLGCKLDAPKQVCDQAGGDITAMVGLAGQLCGVLTVRCDSPTGILMASKMLGVPTEAAGEHLWDALGEICNMIAGNFKNKITGMSDRCMLSVPTVIAGADYNLRALADSGSLEAQFDFDGHPITVSLEIHS